LLKRSPDLLHRRKKGICTGRRVNKVQSAPEIAGSAAMASSSPCAIPWRSGLALLGEIAPVLGGRADMAKSRGKDASQIPALNAARKWVGAISITH
jgi:hypothetical protein